MQTKLATLHGENPPNNPLNFRYVVAEEVTDNSVDYRSYAFLSGHKTPQEALDTAKKFVAAGSPMSEMTILRVEEIPIEWEVQAKLLGFEERTDNVVRLR